MKRSLLYILVGWILLAGCEEDPPIPPPDPLLDEATYLHLLIEMKLVNAFIQATDSTVVPDSIAQAVYNHYQVPEEVFLANHAYYQSMPKQQKARLDSAIKIISDQLYKLDPALSEDYFLRQ